MDGDWWLKSGHPTSPNESVESFFFQYKCMNGLVINHSVDIISISLALFFPLGLVQWRLKETTTFDIPSENYLDGLVYRDAHARPQL